MTGRIVDHLAQAVVDCHENYVRERGCRCGQCCEYRCAHCDQADAHATNCVVLVAQRVIAGEV